MKEKKKSRSGLGTGAKKKKPIKKKILKKEKTVRIKQKTR